MKPNTSYLSVTDLFCGAGGSSDGAARAGAEIIIAANHWKLAIETHNTNFPNTLHIVTDISRDDPRRFPSTDILIASPECTNHSLAKGVKRKNMHYTHDLFGNAIIDPAEERSRATMWDVVRFTEYHQYNAIIVENVVDARHWVLFDSWIKAMHALGYRHQCVYLNSMFAHPTPQSRDRMYIAFWRKGNRAPDLDIRPSAWCVKCGRDIDAVQTWKRHDKQWGKYGARNQYVYRCPTCHAEVQPYYFAAANAIDWSVAGERIGDRAKPLSARTMERIEFGLRKFADKWVNGANSLFIGLNDRSVRAIDGHDVLPTQTGSRVPAVVRPAPFIIHTTDRRNVQRATGMNEPLPTQTTTGQPAVIMPYILTNGKSGRLNGVDEALSTVVAAGNHHFLISFYGSSNAASQVSDPIPTVTTIGKHGMVTSDDAISVEDCYFRMLSPREIGRAMAFRDDYVVLGSKKDQVRQYGNAVTPPAMELLVGRVMNALSGKVV